MKYRTLGRTNLRVSLLGLGSGGPSQLGQKSGVPVDQIERLVRHALDRGVNFFDTAATYEGSEEILGNALRGIPRDRYTLATKYRIHTSEPNSTAAAIIDSVERSLKRLRVDAIDIIQWHSVNPEVYKDASDIHIPVLQKLRDQGKVRFLGLTESYKTDLRHEMLAMALRDGCWDTAMVGYNLLSPVPEHELLPLCRKLNIGVICMVAVRRALSRPDLLRERIADAKARGLITHDALPDDDPLGWLVKGDVPSIPAAGYKFVAAHPAIHTVLSGTSRIEHLDQNIEAILGPTLPDPDTQRLRTVFGNVWEPLGN